MIKTLSRLLPKRKSKPAELGRALASKAVDPMEASLQALGRSRKAQVAPALLLATGAGVAFWWWTQWARGAEESEAAGKGGQDEAS
ncbi:hypothetical protein [Caulobacter sp. S45]|uniref:hypothetical protein n=1 Tax=Caulobacter sp. S45 TaxID=1641861 RepID=UPI00157759F1|nr:hypothetical protein [Caulobacter sp. S45]